MTDLPEKKVHEGVVVGKPTKEKWNIRMTIERGAFTLRCECRELLSDGPYPPDVNALMTEHIARRHSQ